MPDGRIFPEVHCVGEIAGCSTDRSTTSYQFGFGADEIPAGTTTCRKTVHNDIVGIYVQLRTEEVIDQLFDVIIIRRTEVTGKVLGIEQEAVEATIFHL